MKKPKPARHVPVDDDEGNKEALGCLAALALLVVIGGGVALFVDFGGDAVKQESVSEDLPITHVEALDEKTVVPNAAGHTLARNLEVEPEDRGRVVARSGVIADLIAQYSRYGAEPEVIERELDRRSICYNGQHGRLVPQIMDPGGAGFALTFGAASYKEGDPLPRLEFFHGLSGDLDHVYYVSLTNQPIRGFDRTGERIPNTRKAVGRVMLEWVAEVANTSCPRRRMDTATHGSGGGVRQGGAHQ